MSIPLPPTIGIVAAGAMGSAIAHKLIQTGSCTVLTNLDGRSDATRKRAHEAGMEDVSLVDMTRRVEWVLSILPPRDAFAFAERLLDAERLNDGARDRGPLVFVDCNAVNPQTVKRIAGLFVGSPRIKFIDAGIIGGPPKAGYDPTFYASVDVEDTGILDEFVRLSEYGLKIKPLTGEGAGIGDASALKMSYAGTTGLFTAMILAAHASSPATAQALLHELHSSQQGFLNQIMKGVPSMLPKAYRWVGEMEEIAGFVGGGEGDTYKGLARLYERVERSVEEEGGDADVLRRFVEDAKKVMSQ